MMLKIPFIIGISLKEFLLANITHPSFDCTNSEQDTQTGVLTNLKHYNERSIFIYITKQLYLQAQRISS